MITGNTLFALEKPQHEADHDRQNRVARVGGLWRQPSYLESYAKACSMLLRAATTDDCIDDVGLPLFYRQRHTVELALKDVINLLLDVAEMERICDASAATWRDLAVALEQDPRKRAHGHQLRPLLDYAKELLVGDAQLPSEFDTLVDIIACIEGLQSERPRPDRLRYSYMSRRPDETRNAARSFPMIVTKGNALESAPPVLLPVGQLDDALRALLAGPMRCGEDDETFLTCLVNESRALDQALYSMGRL